jgi:peptidyl-prolyl cis-trans isomerase SurA
MYQRAEKDKMVPSDDEITKAINDKKTQSGMTSDDWEKQLKESGETEQSVREIAKKELAIKKLVDNITSKVEPPKDSEVEAFFKGNPDAFIDKRGAKFAAIIIDPQNNGEGDTTKNETEAQLRIKEIGQKLGQGVDFATLAREYSEDPQSRMQGGDWRALSEEEMKQAFGPQIADAVMNKMQVGQMFPVQVEGRYLLLKLQQKKEQNENLTLESPGVKQQITDVLVNARKQLISQAFIEQVMNEAKIENYLAKQIVDNPNAMSGARPADAQTAASPAATPAESPAASPAAANTNASTAASPAQNANAAKNANAPKQ